MANGLADLTPQPVVRAEEVEEALESMRLELESLAAELETVEAEADAWEARVAAEGRDVAVADSFIEHVKTALEATAVATQVDLRAARESAHVEAAARVDAARTPEDVVAAHVAAVVVEEVSRVEPVAEPVVEPVVEPVAELSPLPEAEPEPVVEDDPHEVFWREEVQASENGPRAVLTGAALPLLAMALLIAAILLWVG